jgi:hypothetical protein
MFLARRLSTTGAAAGANSQSEVPCEEAKTPQKLESSGKEQEEEASLARLEAI